MDFGWNHPSRGSVTLRATGKYTGEENGELKFEGFLRNLDDQRIFYKE